MMSRLSLDAVGVLIVTAKSAVAPTVSLSAA